MGDLANGPSYAPVITPDGRFVAFYSWASNLVSQDMNDSPDYFVWDSASLTMDRVSLTSAGQEMSGANDIPQLDISADGRFIVFMTDQDLTGENDAFTDDVYLRDRQNGQTTIISGGETPKGNHLPRRDPRITPNGRYVVFQARSDVMTPRNTHKWEVMRWDRLTEELLVVSTNSSGKAANEDSTDPDISADGRFVVFESLADNLIGSDTNGVRDIFVKDLQEGTVIRVSERPGAFQGSVIQTNNISVDPAISQDGRMVAFSSYASNLRTGDENGEPDVYLKDLAADLTVHLSRAGGVGQEANGFSGGAAIGPEGLIAGFSSFSTNLSALDTNNASDVFTWSGRGTLSLPGLPTEDLDGDGLDNWTELTETFTLHFDPDSDDDGFTDSDEIAAGTDPWDPASLPQA